MSILAANTYHPDVLARVYRVLFVDAEAESSWSNLVTLRNTDYARYLTPPDTAVGTAQWDWSIRTGQMAGTIVRLDEKWNRTINAFISTAVEAQAAKRLVQ